MTTQPVLNREGSYIPEWTLADRLRKARLKSGLTQEEFAERLGVKAAAYSHWEAGRNTPRNLVALAQRIEMLTRIPAAWMLGLMDSVPNNDGPGEPKKDDSVSDNEPLDYKVVDSATDDDGSVIQLVPRRRTPSYDQPLRRTA